MIDYNKLGKHIDNVYTGATENSSRKIVTSLQGNILTLTFRSIVNVGRNEELEQRRRELEVEAIKLIDQKIKEIVRNYNSESESRLKSKEASSSKTNTCSFEILTTSHISPIRTYKFSCFKTFELS